MRRRRGGRNRRRWPRRSDEATDVGVVSDCGARDLGLWRQQEVASPDYRADGQPFRVLALYRQTANMKVDMNTVGKWSLAGFVCGLLWVGLSFVFFAVPQSPPVDVVKFVAVLSCPPFLISFLGAPFLNAILYGFASSIVMRLVRRLRT